MATGTRTADNTDRITELRVSGIRTLDNVTLKFSPLTVLIGENGVGKSSIVEACVLLGYIGQGKLAGRFSGVHGGFPALLRHGATQIKLGLRLAGNGQPLEYDIALTKEVDDFVITSETLFLDNGKKTLMNVFRRSRSEASLYDVKADQRTTFQVDSKQTLVSSFGVLPPQPAIPRLVAALQSIQIHVPFVTASEWVARGLRIQSTLRQAPVIENADRLDFGGLNLANAFHTLRSRSRHWETTKEYVKLGLGYDIEDIVNPPDPGGGRIGLAIQRAGIDRPEPAYSLSDGMLTYLAFVALYRLEATSSLIVFDEPEVHLHPSLLGRVVGFFEDMSTRSTVLLCTHSDRLLDGLSNPAESARLAELDERRATRILTPDAAALKAWMSKFSGLGTIRAEGHERDVFQSDDK